MPITSNVTAQEPAGVLQPQPSEPLESYLQTAAQSEVLEAMLLDVETELVVALPPKSRRAVHLRVRTISKAAPHVVFDSPES